MKTMNTDVAYIFVLIIFTSNTYWSFQENVRKNQNISKLSISRAGFDETTAGL